MYMVSEMSIEHIQCSNVRMWYTRGLQLGGYGPMQMGKFELLGYIRWYLKPFYTIGG